MLHVRDRVRRAPAIVLVLTVLAAGLGLLPAAAAAAPGDEETFVVTALDDGDDGSCDPAHCSLREAITAANATTETDHITFGVAGTITPASALPSVQRPAVIDGGTVADCGGLPSVVLDGSAAGTLADGLTLSGGGTTVRGLVLARWGRAGIRITSGANVVECTYAGTDLAGTAARPNQRGIDISSGGSGNRIGGTGAGRGNLLSGNQFQGLAIAGSPADDNVVQGNRIGTDASGTSALGNGSFGGIALGGSGNVVGGTAPGARNVVSGNGQQGIQMPIGASGNTVEGNYIGVDVTGAVALGNATDGVSANGASGSGSRDHVIRGNVIAGNRNSGVQLSGPLATGITVDGNLIGVGADGTTPIGNHPPGSPALGWGVIIGGSDNLVRGNTIANNGTGVAIGTSPAATIAGVTVTENAIDGNGGLGIDLGLDGITPNDAGDGDGGPNGLQNFPVLDEATGGAVAGELDSTPSSTLAVEVFASAACDPSGHGEATRLVGSANVTTGADGRASFSIPVSGVADGEAVTATATAPDGSTSELSACRLAVVEEEPFGRVRVEKRSVPAGATGFAFTGPSGATPEGDGVLAGPVDGVVFTSYEGSSRRAQVLDPVTGVVTTLPIDWANNGAVTWSPDGSRLAYQSSGGITVYDLVTATSTALPSAPVTGNRSLTWSPDGTWIAFDAGDDIWVVRADGTEDPVAVTTGAAADSNPAWGPDGRLAFRSNRSSERVWVGTFDPTTTSLLGLAGLAGTAGVPSQQREMDWSPDGATLVLAAAVNAATDDDLYRVDTDGSGGLQQLTTAAGDDTEPSWSPDGTRIVYASDASGDAVLSVIDADGGEPEVLFDGPGLVRGPDWGSSSALTGAELVLDDGDGVGGRVPAGTSVTFTEQPRDGWVLSSVQCGGHPRAEVDGSSVTFTPDAGDDITCTFTNEAVPVVRPGGAAVVEGDEGTTVALVPLSLSRASTGTVTVAWETLDGLDQPQPGLDYEAASGVVTFEPGQTTATVPVTVIGDRLDEPGQLWDAEWAGLRFHSPTGATIEPGLGQLGLLLVRDDDPPPTITPLGGLVFEGDDGTTTLLARIDLSAPSGQAVSVDWTTLDELDQPQAGVDFEAATGTLTFAPGETSKTVAVTVIGDTVDEPGQLWDAEWGALELSSPSGATFGSGILARLALALIVDDD